MELANECSSLGELKAVEAWARYSANEDLINRTVYWLHGPTGTGKTRWAYQKAKERGAFWMSGLTLRWFDGYMGQMTAILDDLRSTSIEYSSLLRLLDRYPTRVEIKGSSVPWTADLVIITSCYSP